MKPIKLRNIRYDVKHHQISLSGGRTSAKMLEEWLKALDGEIPENSSILFANTGREEEATLKFLHDIETYWGVPVTWLEYDRVPAKDIDLSIFPTKRRASYVENQADRGEMTHWFKVASYETAHRIGQPNSPFDKLLEWMTVLPNVRGRSCSAQLKARTMARYMWSRRIYEFTSYIGYRADEMDRAAGLLASRDTLPGNTFCFPLCDLGITEDDVMKFWASQPFDLSIQQFEGNCDLCFMKKADKRIEIMRRRPDRAQWWIDWERRRSEKGMGGRFRLEQSYQELLDKSKTALPMYQPEPADDVCGACTTGTLEWSESDD